MLVAQLAGAHMIVGKWWYSSIVEGGVVGYIVQWCGYSSKGMATVESGTWPIVEYG